jgi:hypothetical protein
MSQLRNLSQRAGTWAGCLLIGAFSAWGPLVASGNSIFTDWPRLAEAIASVDRPDAGWVAATYIATTDAPRAAALLQRSVSAAPDDPVIAFAALQACGMIRGCDVAQAAQHLRAVDPANGFSALPELQAALSGGDYTRVDAALVDMSGRSEWRAYWNQSVTRATAVHVLAALGLPPGEAGELTDESSSHLAATGVVSKLLPALLPITTACAHRASPRRARCIEIARGLQRGDAVITQSLGYSIELNLTAAGSPEHEVAVQRRNELQWLMRSQAPASSSQAAEFRELQATLDREEDVVREVLRRHGKPAQPPPNWDPGR